jgi:hypothetical protein
MPRRIQNLPDPEVLAQKIVEDLEAALEQFCEIATDLGADVLTEKDEKINRCVITVAS